MTFFIVLLIPVVIAAGAFFLLSSSINWKEFLLQLGLGVVAVAVGWQVAKWGALQSTEHLNGRITQKEDGTQHCCHCHDVCDAKDKNGNCTSSHEECSHTIDYYWTLKTTVGDVPVEDCSGWNSAPAIWTNAVVGEPASVSHGYTNYLLADPDSLMVHAQVEKWADQVPDYPEVFDKYKVNHVLGDVSPPVGMQKALQEINADLGAGNQVDISVYLTAQKDPSFAQAIEAKWLYGPKNSITVVMGLSGTTIQWVRVVTFSKVEQLKVQLRDQLQGLNVSDPKVLAVLRSEIQQKFRRTAMADFEYLAATASPTGWSLVLLLLGEFVVSVLLTYWMHVKDVFGVEPFRGYRARKPF